MGAGPGFPHIIYIYIDMPTHTHIYIYISILECYPTIHLYPVSELPHYPRESYPLSTSISNCKYRYLGGFGAVPAVLRGFGNYVGSGDGVPP